MLTKIKTAFYLLLSTLFVLFAAYALGGRAARKAIKLKQKQEKIDRLEKTVKVKNEVDSEIRSKSDDAVIDELHADWMRK
ncbi:hypothetical protein ABZ131_20525 [Providencia rettgeri]